MFRPAKKTAGLSLVEAVLVSALILVVFGGLFTGVQYSLELIAQSRAKLSALSLANDRMEFFRSLPYDDVGTIAGIPPGTIPQNSTTTLNNIEFSERVLVEYVDDPADGAITATTTDSNGIPSDYKRIKIEISWNIYDTPGQISLVSNIVPRSIETTVGGGTVRVNVIDQDSLPLENAEVRLRNDTTTSTIDVTRFSDANGIALFSGAPAASNYELIVTAPGYSIDQTYIATTSNPNPTTAPFAVLESDISTLTFQIDRLSDIQARALSSVTFASADEFFTSSTSIATSTDVAIVGNALVLAGGSGNYPPNGDAYLPAVTPGSLVTWEAATLGIETPANTSFSTQFYTASGTDYTLIPDTDLPGNASGFTTRTINLSVLDVSTYPNIVPRVRLNSSNDVVTPRLDEVRVFYRASETAANGVSVGFSGTKIIGTNGGAPIYKYDNTEVTNASGEINLTDIEFDSYTVTVPSTFDIAYSCPALPLVHRGGVDSALEFRLAPNTAHSLQVRVIDTTGSPIPGAAVELVSATTSYSGVVETNPCGTAFFSGLSAADDYLITVEQPGYVDGVIDPYTVSGDTNTLVILNES
jgi:hypothetical protein